MTRADRLVLATILVLGAALRTLDLREPLLDAHRWRQVDTAGIARHFFEDSMNPFSPKVNWGGRDGYVESEFPLVPFLAAVLYKIVGPYDWLGRYVSILFSLATIVVVHALARRLASPGAARAAAWLVAVSPGAVFFGRTFMPDAAMLFFSTAAVLGFVAYFQDGRRDALWLGSAAAAFAWLVKIPALMILAPIGAAAWNARRGRALADARFLAAVAVPLAVTTAWYAHAYRIYLDSGLTFGILVQPAKTYPISIAPGPWISTFSKWSTPELLTSFEFYERLFARLYHFHLTPLGALGAIAGAVLWRGPDRRIADWWLLAMIAFVLVGGEGHRAHDYYQLPFVPIAALYFGFALGPLFDGARVRALAGRHGPLWVGALALAAGVISFHYSGVLTTHFRRGSLDLRMLQAGAALDRAAADDELAVVVDDYGVTSPMLLYFAHLRGWSFDVANLSPHMLDRLRKTKGARFFATTVWPQVEAERPEVADYLRLFRPLPLTGAPADMAAFDLNERK